MQGFFKSRLVLTLITLVLVLGVTVVTLTTGLLQLRPKSAVAASADRVLILAGTVTGGSSSIEASEAAADGMAVDVVDATTWSSMTAAQFASYRAIILGDPTCSGITPDITAAAANSKVWGPTINGNIVILGTDPVYHASQGGETVTRRGVDFAVNQVGKTGAYITLSCYYHGTAPNTPVPLLDGVGAGGFTVTGVGCYNNAHIVAESPALSSLTDANISNWSCSVHEAFQTWSSGLIPLAIAKDFDSSYTASDGTQGPPYILAGGDIRSFPLSITPLNDSATAGGPHTVTAQLLDGATLSPLVGAKIGFQVVAGPNAGVTGVCSNPSCVTGTDGNVSWTYTSNGSSGSDTIEAFYDMNKNGTADIGEPQTTAGMQWTAAPAKTLVGLGDSIAAGHGLGPSVGFPDNADAYPLQLAKQLGYGGYDYAISGACAASPNKDGGSSSTPSGCTTSVLSDELPAIGVKPNVITLTVGANDISFGDCFKAVVLKVGTNPCSGSTFNSNLGALSKNLSTLYAAIKQQYPGIPIYEMLYYNPLPLAPSSTSQICPASRVIAGIDKKNNLGYIQSLYLGATGQFDADAATVQGNLFVTAQQIINKLNSTIKNAATAAGVTTVAQDFTGHDFCQTLIGGSVADAWVYGPTFHGFFEAFSVVTDKKFPFDIDAPSVCPAPHTGDATQYYTSGNGGWDGVAYTYAFTLTINCLPHPTIDGQRAIAAAFKTKITP